jgi:RTX calcium-binding nonapeptide repeat (4 copies)
MPTGSRGRVASVPAVIGSLFLRRRPCGPVLVGLCCAAWLGFSAGTGSTSSVSAAVSPQEAEQLRADDRGIYVHYCPAGQEAASIASYRPKAARRAHLAMASHAGWPADECLKMDKGSDGVSHTLVGLKNVHNWLLGGYGNDTVYGGEAGDVIWGDYQPSGQSESERDYLHGGNGNDWIYSSHGFNEIWTGGGDDHLLLVYGHGVVHCNGPGVKTLVMRYLPSNRPWTLLGCTHKVIDPYRA